MGVYGLVPLPVYFAPACFQLLVVLLPAQAYSKVLSLNLENLDSRSSLQILRCFSCLMTEMLVQGWVLQYEVTFTRLIGYGNALCDLFTPWTVWQSLGMIVCRKWRNFLCLLSSLIDNNDIPLPVQFKRCLVVWALYNIFHKLLRLKQNVPESLSLYIIEIDQWSQSHQSHTFFNFGITFCRNKA